jgi:hypothetical protein
MRCFIVAATIAVAAATFDGEVRETKDFWAEGDAHQASQAKLAGLTARANGVAGAMNSVTAGIKLVQSNIERLDKVVERLAELKGDVVTAKANGENAIASAASSADFQIYTEGAVGTATAGVQEAKDLIAIDGISGALGMSKNLAARTQNKLDKEFKELSESLTKDINNKLKAVKGSNYFTANHIKQVTGIDVADHSKYWDGKTYTSESNNGEVRGRKFYKVKFNLKSKGYRTSGDSEIFLACRALSNYLRSKDGKERDLRPPCNHYNHRRTGGLGQCVFIRQSYFSHSHNGGGYWGWKEAGGGIKEEVLRMTSGYEQNNHNNDHHLVHRGPNSHTWWKAYRSGSYEYTMCTSGNRFYKE